MASGTTISCKQFQNFLVSQEPVYDKEILSDIRPSDGFIGYYETSAFDAYSGVEHTFDRFRAVFPNVTRAWNQVSSTDCVGSPCDPDENKIGWGYDRNTYRLETQSWGSQLLCFDEIMNKTRAKEHFRQIIDQVLRPATNWIMTYFLQRRLMDLASVMLCVRPGLPAMTFSWEGDSDGNAYVYLNTSADPTGRITGNILQSRVDRQYHLGATMASKESYSSLEFQTDKDTLQYLLKQDPTIQDNLRLSFKEFDMAAKEYWKYGFRAHVGDFMVKVLQAPLRFNKVSAGRYQLVLPYKNVSATAGIGDDWNEDYQNAQYQISQINNPKGITVRPFMPEAVNSMMPFKVRDYGGKWQFVTNDLGADCNGRPIDNSRGNKGKFIADFKLALKPSRPEWMECFFHKVDKPCITIIEVCNDDPGYPEQSYDSENATCDRVQVFTVAAASDGHYKVSANTITCDGNTITQTAIDVTTLADLITALNARFATASLTGTWAIYDADLLEIKLTGSACAEVQVPFDLS